MLNKIWIIYSIVEKQIQAWFYSINKKQATKTSSIPDFSIFYNNKELILFPIMHTLRNIEKKVSGTLPRALLSFLIYCWFCYTPTIKTFLTFIFSPFGSIPVLWQVYFLFIICYFLKKFYFYELSNMFNYLNFSSKAVIKFIRVYKIFTSILLVFFELVITHDSFFVIMYTIKKILVWIKFPWLYTGFDPTYLSLTLVLIIYYVFFLTWAVIIFYFPNIHKILKKYLPHVIHFFVCLIITCTTFWSIYYFGVFIVTHFF